MSIVTRILAFIVVYVVVSKGLALIGMGATLQLVIGLVAAAGVSVAIGDATARKKRRDAGGSSDPWQP